MSLCRRNVGFLSLVLCFGLAPWGSTLFGSEVLWHEDFEGGGVEGWRYTTSALESSGDVALVATPIREGSGLALLGEGGVARVALTKRLDEADLSFDVDETTYLTVSFFCRASRSAEDEVVIEVGGTLIDAAGSEKEETTPVYGSITLPVRTALNRWRTVTVPLVALVDAEMSWRLNRHIQLRYLRPVADDYALIVDDVMVTGGTAEMPCLVESGTLRSDPPRISPNGDGSRDSTRVTAAFVENLRWNMAVRSREGALVCIRSGTGKKLDQAWDGRDEAGQLVGPGRYIIEIGPTRRADGVAGVSARTTVQVVAEPPEEVMPVLNLRSVGVPVRVDRRMAADRMLRAPRRHQVNPQAEAIEIVMPRNAAVGVGLELTAGQGDIDTVSVGVTELVGAHNLSLGVDRLRVNHVTYETVSGGYLWEDIRRVAPSFALRRGHAMRLEVVVNVPQEMLAGVYEGTIEVAAPGTDGARIGLRVEVEPDVAQKPWWQYGPVKVMLAKYQVMPRPEFFEQSEKGYEKIANAGFNIMVPYTAYARHELYSSRAAKYGLQAIARSWILCVGNPETPEPRFVIGNGTQLPVLCPYSDQRWGNVDTEADITTPIHLIKLIGNAKYFARMSLDYPLVGMVIDFELYEVGRPRPSPVYTYCYCDHCIAKFREHSGAEIPSLDSGQRYTWLREQGLLADYKRYEDDELRRYARMMREAVHAINPNMMFFLFPWEGHFAEVVAKELGTAEVPIILGTEHTYGQGSYGHYISDQDESLARNRGICLDQLKHARMAEIDHLYLAGIMPGQHAWEGGDTPDFCEKNAVTLARYGDGYWVFFQRTGQTWQEKRFHDHTVDDYLNAFQRANDRIDAGTYALPTP